MRLCTVQGFIKNQQGVTKNQRSNRPWEESLDINKENIPTSNESSEIGKENITAAKENLEHYNFRPLEESSKINKENITASKDPLEIKGLIGNQSSHQI